MKIVYKKIPKKNMDKYGVENGGSLVTGYSVKLTKDKKDKKDKKESNAFVKR